MEKEEFYKQLVDRYVTNQASEEELEAFFHLLEAGEIDDTLNAYLSQEDKTTAEQETTISRPNTTIKRFWPKIAAAASILIVLTAGILYLTSKQKTSKTSSNKLVQNDIKPGHDQATLTLANGKTITLKKGMNGQLATQGSTKINVSNEQLSYNSTQKEQQTQYNTLTTKRGEASPYPLELGDGSKVWLNAASSITFPTSFSNAKNRTVTVTGEAYFEVKHNEHQPFIVKAGNQTVQDIGTSFDVNSYSDESTQKTTLIEGSAKINNTAILKPGQQAELSNNNISIRQVNTSEITAWKDHKFLFSNEPLEEIMKQAARWYDVDIQYEDEALKNKTFGTIAQRFETASKFLHKLELTGEVRFKIEGRKITVMNK